MDITVTEAAEELGLDERTVRAHVMSGRLQVTRVIGRTQLIEHAGVQALQRGSGRGRLWNATTAWAALELLDIRTTRRLGGSERSRLRARLRGISVAQLAHLASGRGRLRRFAQVRGDRERLRAQVQLSGVTALEDEDVASVFDLVGSPSRLTMGYVPDLREVALRNGLVESAEGDVFLRELGEHQAYIGLSTIALDLYELGDTRESAAGARFLGSRLQ